MEIYPSIDIMNGKCVRLFKGDFNESTQYSDNPLNIALNYEKLGARFLHVIDLDGARDGIISNIEAISSICSKTRLAVQAGGGIRNKEDIEMLIGSGVERIITGSIALKNPDRLKTWLEWFGNERIVIAFDIFHAGDIPYIMIEGWQQDSRISLWDCLEECCSIKIKYLICTDIDRDGTLMGSNLLLYKEIKRKYPDLFLFASGGVNSIEDVISLQEAGLDAVIIGKALYEKRVSLKEVLDAC
ncbi:MAG: 1-(5-phosphoribosyl)-5-[(5-phosphoribosylamino)methylideneamino]imidazole-4-carboxamide isomerase [Candidatus Coatesbacteria bacterium]|nr:1-(5-phosphoribosyl)-5-[(5-phosphoribosylamino)methylideneamino]imidazole-4-carboxamide isomerase [Candidatus Coatesbacteria bacterium]